MRNLLALFGALVLGFGGVGWYLGWYQVHVAKTPEGNLQIKTDVDTEKVTHDSGAAYKQVAGFVSEKLDKAGQAPTPGTTPGPVPPAAGPPQEQEKKPGPEKGLRLFGRDILPKGGN